MTPGVYRLTPEIALIQTVDFFTPVVNDPYTFGQIAAANALSDVYAMGGRPLTALNIVCYPSKTVPQEVLLAILAGGLDKIHEAGALLVGGHSVDDTELKYGLSVTGVVHPDKVLTNGGARVGDQLILTKPLGTGVIATAMKGRLASPEACGRGHRGHDGLEPAAGGLPGKPRRCMPSPTSPASAFWVTPWKWPPPVTSRSPSCAHQVPVLAAAKEYAAMGLVPAGSFANRRFCDQHLQVAPGIDPLLVDLFSDAQTNGGLLLAVAPDQAEAFLDCLKGHGIHAAAIGAVTGQTPGSIRLEP